MWLPETACNDADAGDADRRGTALRHPVAAPGRAARAATAASGSTSRRAASIPRVPYRYRHRDGAGARSRSSSTTAPIAQRDRLRGGARLERAAWSIGSRAAARGDRERDQLIHVATDGETYGHHHALRRAHAGLRAGRGGAARAACASRTTAPAGRAPAHRRGALKPGPGGEGTAWSCAHGVGRWCRDCGCQTGGRAGWSQDWRAPLRQALDLLRDEARADLRGPRRGALARSVGARATRTSS